MDDNPFTPWSMLKNMLSAAWHGDPWALFLIFLFCIIQLAIWQYCNVGWPFGLSSKEKQWLASRKEAQKK